MGEVEEVLAIGIHLEAICTTTNGQIKELSRTKWVVGDLPLLRSPRAIQKAVPNHSALGHAGVNVQSHVPRGSHLEVDDKAGAERKAGVRWGYGRGAGGAPCSPRKEGTGAWTPGSPMEEGIEGSDS